MERLSISSYTWSYKHWKMSRFFSQPSILEKRMGVILKLPWELHIVSNIETIHRVNVAFLLIYSVDIKWSIQIMIMHACFMYVLLGLRDESALGRTPLLSPTSVTSGYKSDVSYDRKLFTSSWQFVAELFPLNLLSYVIRRRLHCRIYKGSLNILCWSRRFGF